MKLWNNSRIIGSFCFVFERTNSPNKNDIPGWVILFIPKLPSEFVFKFGGIFMSFFRQLQERKMAVKRIKSGYMSTKEELCKEYKILSKGQQKIQSFSRTCFSETWFQRKKQYILMSIQNIEISGQR